jgi:DNA mismatch repair protein MutS2
MMDEAGDRLELGTIKAALLERARTPLGALEIHALEPFPTIGRAKERIEAIRQVRSLLLKDEAPPVQGAEDVRAALSLGEKGVMLEGAALRAIAETMRAGSYLRRHLLAHEKEAPLLYGMAASLPDLSRPADEVTRSFDPDGQLADSASLELGPLRRRVRSLRDMIKEAISEILNKTEIQPFLQESYFTIRGDRYVLPIKASFKNEVKGIVHDASGSGQTVFIEPSAIVDLGNRLKIAQSEQTEEEHRILSMLTMRVTAEAEPIREMMRVIGLVDLMTAAARLANDLDAQPIIPLERPSFDLIAARHPLLVLQARAPNFHAAAEGGQAPKDVVANDLGLEGEQLVLVLTGPNTGGKTVAMKTVGLLALMVRAGLHVPCGERSRIGWFDRIEVAIGDQQSIASHLSTFAAHMKMIQETIARADEHTLVLIDEIAADTDPTQGQALAQAILERLAAKGAHTIVTTHFERLKAVPFVDKRFRNAGVGFDPLRLAPTYKVTLDLPQSSSGLEIARSLGLPSEIVDRAEELTGEGGRALEKLMLDLQARAGELEDQRRAAARAEKEAREEKQKLHEAERMLEREKQLVRREARAELLKEIEATRQEVKRIIGALQNAAEHQSARDAMRLATEAQTTIGRMEDEEEAKHKAELEPEEKKDEPLSEVHVGDWVHVKQLGKDGDVVSIDGKEAQVAVGSLRIRVPLAVLLPARSRRPKMVEGADRARLRKELSAAQRRRPVGGPRVVEELDLRGHSIDESLDRLDAFLDHHYGSPTTHVRIVHGHGTGVLRTAIRNHLKESGYVRSLRPGDEHEGGDGATIVELA